VGARAAEAPARPHRSEPLSTAGPTTVPYAEALAASGDDEFVRWQVDPLQSPTGWVVGDAVAFVRRRPDGHPALTVVGPPADAARALRNLVPGNGFTRTSVPFGTLDELALDPGAVVVGEGADWEWMVTDSPPPTSTVSSSVQWLTDDDAPAISALLLAASPRHSADPGDDDVRGWVGVRADDGSLVACAAHTEAVPGVPHLASIATHPSVRGQGLGSVVTGTLVQRLLDAGAPVVTLGMYSDNAVARRMYHSLGFRCRHLFSSRALL
jgi:ribosomal protein S18 acetylase RimI-like enzyme